MTLKSIENQFSNLIENLDKLKQVSAAVGQQTCADIKHLRDEISRADAELQELQHQVKEKELKESLHQSSVTAADLQHLVHNHIEIPESFLQLYWHHLKLRVEGLSAGGVSVTLGFPAESRLPNLKFFLKHNTSGYSVTDCDPMVIGLAELVAQLNTDSRGGALARFCCRIRARYTAQYMKEF